MAKNHPGFTLVEVLVVVIVISMLTVMGAFYGLQIQKSSRDKTRAASIRVVQESLEKYYDKNGEYPAVSKITDANVDTVKTFLGLQNDTSSFIAPRAPSGTINSWKSALQSNVDVYVYTGNTDTSASCLSGTSSTDSCKDFKIQYTDELSNTTKTITSRRVSTVIP